VRVVVFFRAVGGDDGKNRGDARGGVEGARTVTPTSFSTRRENSASTFSLRWAPKLDAIASFPRAPAH
jgi:hypothetical protein